MPTEEPMSGADEEETSSYPSTEARLAPAQEQSREKARPSSDRLQKKKQEKEENKGRGLIHFVKSQKEKETGTSGHEPQKKQRRLQEPLRISVNGDAVNSLCPECSETVDATLAFDSPPLPEALRAPTFMEDADKASFLPLLLDPTSAVEDCVLEHFSSLFRKLGYAGFNTILASNPRFVHSLPPVPRGEKWMQVFI